MLQRALAPAPAEPAPHAGSSAVAPRQRGGSADEALTALKQAVSARKDLETLSTAYHRAEAEGVEPAELRGPSLAVLKAAMAPPELSRIDVNQLGAAINAGQRAGLEKRHLDPARSKLRFACEEQGRMQYRDELWQGK